MPDHGPPRLASDERETLCTALQYVRESFVRKLDDLDDDGARWSPVGSGTSLLWLTRHLAYAESVWVLRRFAGRPDDVPPNGVPDGDTLAAAVEAYRATWRAVDEVVAGASLDEGCRADDTRPPVNLRWILVHLVEEIARHAGHADVIRELRDGATGR